MSNIASPTSPMAASPWHFMNNLAINIIDAGATSWLVVAGRMNFGIRNISESLSF